MGKTLSIETGIRCGNRCGFCYQSGWRESDRLPDPGFDALAERMAWGRENGFDAVGLSGGEPTIRKDFLDLVRHARKLGYSRVAVTTNGRRFQNETFARQAVEAGLDGIGWSIHGPEAALHDRLVGRDGAFDQARRGLANVARAARELDRRVDQNLFTLVNRLNAERIPEIGRLALRAGIRLVVMQPVIYSKGNLASAAELALPLDDLVAAIRNAARRAAREGWFVKLFNLPACFVTDVASGIEHQSYPVEIFRYQESRAAGESRPAPGIGFVRLDRCAECLLGGHCPGLHQSLLPSEVLGRMHEETLAVPAASGRSWSPAAPISGNASGLWTAGMELLDASAVARFVARLKGAAPEGRVRIYHGGDSVMGDAFLPALERAGVAELCLVVRLGDPGSTDLSIRTGNLERIRELLQAPALSGGRMQPWLAVPYARSEESRLVPTLAGLVRGRSAGLELQVPADFKNPEVFELARFARIGAQWARAGGRRFRIVIPDASRRGTPLFRLPLALTGLSHFAADHMCTHWHCGPGGTWIASSLPSFLSARPTGAMALPPVPGLPGTPVDERILSRMRPG